MEIKSTKNSRPPKTTTIKQAKCLLCYSVTGLVSASRVGFNRLVFGAPAFEWED